RDSARSNRSDRVRDGHVTPIVEQSLTRRALLRSAGAGGRALLAPDLARAGPFVHWSARPGGNVVLRWNNALLPGVRDSKLGAPMVSRGLAIAQTCIYDAWAAYDARPHASAPISRRGYMRDDCIDVVDPLEGQRVHR